MGDTGSLVIGFFIAMLVIKFCQANLDTTIAYPVQSAPAVAFGILMIPLYDTLRVFVSRMLSNGSPFKADKNHIHHILLRLGYSHLKSTIILVLVSIFFIILSFFLQDIGMTKLITVLIVLGAIFTTYLIHLNNIIKKKEKS
jgi:UDP-N-acetylmuramyl pentapeptide phosphotransferase/UDP-N-acetylglucosamine-1-phosphate transferase